MRRIARLRFVMSDTAEICMALEPAYTYLVCSTRSSTSTDTSRTPLLIMRSSMQRSAAEKPVMERNGFSFGPTLSLLAESSTGCFTPMLLQPSSRPAVSSADTLMMPRRRSNGVFMAASFRRESLFALVVGVDHIAGDHHHDFLGRVTRFGADRVADVDTAASAGFVLRRRRAGVGAALLCRGLLGLELGDLGAQQIVHVVDFGLDRLHMGRAAHHQHAYHENSLGPDVHGRSP